MWFNHCVKEVFSKYNIWSKEDLKKFNDNPKDWLKKIGLELNDDQFEEMKALIELCTTNEIEQNEHFLDYEIKSKRKTKKRAPLSKSSYKPWTRDNQNNIMPNL
jgi:hypothetical protein